MDKTVTTADLQQVRDRLRQVCSLAIADINVSPRQEPTSDDDGDLHSYIRMLQSTIERMGWSVDVSLKRLGDPGCFARAEDWMLPGA